MTGLERRYRFVLRVLPRWYRAERAEETVATFLADRDDEFWMEYGWPGWAETWAVLVLAVRTRLAGSAAPARVVATGDMVRAVALLGLFAHAVLAAAALVEGLPETMRLRMVEPTLAVRVAVNVAGSVAVLVAFAALIRGRRSLAREAAIVAVAPGLVELGRTVARDTAWLDPVLTLAWATPCCSARSACGPASTARPRCPPNGPGTAPPRSAR